MIHHYYVLDENLKYYSVLKILKFWLKNEKIFLNRLITMEWKQIVVTFPMRRYIQPFEDYRHFFGRIVSSQLQEKERDKKTICLNIVNKN